MKSVSPPPQLYFPNVLSTTTKPEFANLLIQAQWIQPALCLSIVSHSHLLHEALISLLENHWGSRLSKHFIASDLVSPHLKGAGISSSTENLPKHLVLLDYGIGRDATLAYIQQWRSLIPSAYIVVVELKDEDNLILDCIEAGTHGYALQGASSIEIANIIEQVYRGATLCSPEITAKLFERLAKAKMLTPQAELSLEKPPLTQRELEVLCHVAKGCGDRDIATELMIEVRTVKHHIHNLLRKLNVKYRWQAAQLAVKNGWLARS
jgi:DNA-binding NarL/FixJ family response regulator